MIPVLLSLLLFCIHSCWTYIEQAASKTNLKITPSKTRKWQSIDLSLCIICQTPSYAKFMCATAEGKEIRWNAACLRKDGLYKTRVNEFDTAFIESKNEIFYYKNIIVPYRSQRNLKH